MKMSKEDEELLAQFAAASLQGWLARYPENESINRLNYGVVARGCYMMAKSMLVIHKQVVNSGLPDKSE